MSGPVSRKLAFLRDHFRAGIGPPFEPLTVEEMTQVVAVLDALVAQVAALEARPVPPGWRVVEGGRNPDAPGAA